MLTLDLTVRDPHNVTTPTHSRELAALVEDVDWDEYSLWGRIPGEGIGGASRERRFWRGRRLAGVGQEMILAYARTDWPVTGIVASMYWQDLLEYLLWEDYALTHGVERDILAAAGASLHQARGHAGLVGSDAQGAGRLAFTPRGMSVPPDDRTTSCNAELRLVRCRTVEGRRAI